MSFWLFVLNASLCALNVGFAIATGSGFSAAAAVFCGFAALFSLACAVRG